LGGDFQVISHVSLIRDLIHDAKITPLAGSQKIAYHDPCYLGRHNNLFDDPREVIDSIGNIVELPRSRNNSFCCGAGGGNYWNDESGQRINYVRAREAFETGAKKIAAACPFCLLMLTDGVKMVSEEKVVFDIAEIIEQHIESNL
jgi:Fe-S oxidoreductase